MYEDVEDVDVVYAFSVTRITEFVLLRCLKCIKTGYNIKLWYLNVQISLTPSRLFFIVYLFIYLFGCNFHCLLHLNKVVLTIGFVNVNCFCKILTAKIVITFQNSDVTTTSVKLK